ncbi:MAG: hypothetical protein MEQ84_11795 [Mesorhizobium sp.]|nr:hypothetical protein [Mesorhizobium sp.]
MTKRNAKIGSISHGTLRVEDLLDAFATELDYLSGDNVACAQVAALPDFEGEEAVTLLGELNERLEDLAPAYCYFGAHEGDGSDFGFWPCLECVEDLPRVADPADVEAMGEDCVFVNDHGNVTVYGANGVVIWDCV